MTRLEAKEDLNNNKGERVEKIMNEMAIGGPYL